eukprot:scaffold4808_cov215-Prasinococcus_capsulatus_cf.AAC.3
MMLASDSRLPSRLAKSSTNIWSGCSARRVPSDITTMRTETKPSELQSSIEPGVTTPCAKFQYVPGEALEMESLETD